MGELQIIDGSGLTATFTDSGVKGRTINSDLRCMQR
jgi:hypothetical protein